MSNTTVLEERKKLLWPNGLVVCIVTCILREKTYDYELSNLNEIRNYALVAFINTFSGRCFIPLKGMSIGSIFYYLSFVVMYVNLPLDLNKT